MKVCPRVKWYGDRTRVLNHILGSITTGTITTVIDNRYIPSI